MSGERIVVFDDKKFYCFDKKSGNFLFKIDSYGRGPAEYWTPIDFYMDNRSGRIEILDELPRKILVFDDSGVFLEEFDIPPYARGLDKLSDAEYLFYLNNQVADGDSSNLIYWNRDTGGTFSYSPMNENLVGVYLTGLQSFYRNDNRLFVRENFSNEILEFLSPNVGLKKMRINFNVISWMDFNLMNGMNFNGAVEGVLYIRDQGKLFNLNAFLPFNKEFLVITTNMKENVTYYGLGDWETNKFKLFNSIENDLDGLNPAPLTDVYYYNEVAVSLISGFRCRTLYNAITHKEKLANEINNILSRTSIKYNGIVLIYK